MSNKILSYLEFRKAAYRNLSVCEILLKMYDVENNKIVKNHILFKTFYLGGYVIEFLYKFSLFSHLNVSITQDVYDYRTSDFQKKWKVHNFDHLSNLCQDEGIRFSTDIPYFGNNIQNKNVAKLIEAWDVQIRYSLVLSRKDVILNYVDLKHYVEIIKDINKKINTQYI